MQSSLGGDELGASSSATEASRARGHTFAVEALAAGISVFELSRLMVVSIAMIDRTYGRLARDSEAVILARLNARADRDGVEMASGAESGDKK